MISPEEDNRLTQDFDWVKIDRGKGLCGQTLEVTRNGPVASPEALRTPDTPEY
jgi:hypothetical protein